MRLYLFLAATKQLCKPTFLSVCTYVFFGSIFMYMCIFLFVFVCRCGLDMYSQLSFSLYLFHAMVCMCVNIVYVYVVYIICLYLYVYVFSRVSVCVCAGSSLSVCISVHVTGMSMYSQLCWISSCSHSVSEYAMFQSTNQSGLSFSGLIESVHVGWCVVFYDGLMG